MLNPHHEELAYRYAFERLSDQEQDELWAAAKHDTELAGLIGSYSELNEELALAVPQLAVPDSVKRAVLTNLPSQKTPEPVVAEAEHSETFSNILHVTFWFPYAAAAALMVCCLYEYWQLNGLQSQVSQLNASLAKAQQENTLNQLRLTQLKSQDQVYNEAEVLLAWNAAENKGILTLKNLPPPPAGHDYQLWLLPAKGTPASAGVMANLNGTIEFHVEAAEINRLHLTASDVPGFAVSVEPTGGSPAPTGQVILVAAGN